MSRPYCVGLTGGIGSGKSAVADHFLALGAAVVDTDVIARELTGPGGAAMPVLREVFAAAGDAALFLPDGSIDRPAMRRRVFADAAVRQRLEAVLHPLIRAESERRVLAAAAAPYAVLVVPLLVESGNYLDRVDRVLVVDCDEEKQIERVAARNGLERTEIVRILAAQASRPQRLAAANDVVLNDSSLSALAGQVAKLDAIYRDLAAKRAPTS